MRETVLIALAFLIGAFAESRWALRASAREVQAIEAHPVHVSRIYDGHPAIWHINGVCVARFEGYKAESAVIVPCPWDKK